MYAKKLKMGKAKTFLKQCSRVWKVTKKPTRDEFKNIAKISAIGLTIIGVIGFIIAMIFTLILK